MIVVDGEVDLDDSDMVLFHLVANMDPGRDLHRDVRRLGIDGTSKIEGEERNGQPVRKWPPAIRMDVDVTNRMQTLLNSVTDAEGEAS